MLRFSEAWDLFLLSASQRKRQPCLLNFRFAIYNLKWEIGKIPHPSQRTRRNGAPGDPRNLLDEESQALHLQASLKSLLEAFLPAAKPILA